jgi:YggT family protein
MTSAIIYLVDSLLTIYLYVLIMRLVMQLTRADFRNQVAHFILVVTNPIVMPLRRILPPVGKVDTASVLAIVLVAAATIGAISLIAAHSLPNPIDWLYATGTMLLRAFIVFFIGCIFVYALLSFVVQGGYSPIYALLGTVVEPVLKPFRRIIPPIAGWDLSTLWALLALGALLRLLQLG